jgi:hypothetical protein
MTKAGSLEGDSAFVGGSVWGAGAAGGDIARDGLSSVDSFPLLGSRGERAP